MRASVRLGRTGFLAAGSVAGLLVLSAAVGAQAGLPPFAPWSAAVRGVGTGSLTAARSAGAAAGKSGGRHFNVGNPHSPRLLRQFTSGAAGTAAPATPLSGAVQGIDVASQQHPKSKQYPNGAPINWSNVAGSGKQFAAIKVTEGDYYQNPYALGDLPRAKAAGLAVVAYAFAIPNGGGSSASPVKQADDAINYLQSGPAGVPPIMLDIEYDPYSASDGTNECYGLSQSAMGTWVQDFAAEVQSRTGRPPIVYTTTGWWNACVGTAVSLGQDPLWIAATGTSSPGTLPDGWSKASGGNGQWGYWQYGTASVAGITGSVDTDQLNPGVFTLLDPGDQQDAAGSTITPVQLQSSMPNVTYTATGLPEGLAITSAGNITGTAPAALGTSQVTVTATAGTAQQSVSFTWYVHGSLAVTAPSVTSTSGGLPVSMQAKASDSAAEPPVTFSAPALLNMGMSVSASGKITGWADKPGTYQVTVYAADALQAAGSATFTWTVSVAPGTGPAGAVQLGFGGKCLHDTGNKSANGNTVEIWTCNGSAAQQWTYAQDDSLRIHGKCLQSPATEDWKARIEPCTGAADEQWQLVFPFSVSPSANSATLALYNPGSGMCLDDPASSTTNGTKQVVWPCDGNSKQEWTLPTGPIQSEVPGKCVDDSRNRTANGTKIDIYQCKGSTAQQWQVRTDGTVRIHGKCLNVQGDGTASGTRVNLNACNGSGGTRWHLIAAGGGALLQNLHSKLCLAIPGQTAPNGRQLEILSCDPSRASMVWRAS